MLAGICLALALGLAAVWQDRDAVFESEAHLILDRAVALRRDVTQALSDIREIGAVPCSARDLEELRLIALRSSHILNLGRVSGGRIVCDIIYGADPPTTLLGPADFTSTSGVRFWREAPIYMDGRLRSAAASSGGAIVFSRPAPFAEFVPALGNASVLVTHSVASYIYTRLGGQSASAGAPKAVGGWFDHRFRDCDESNRLCVSLQAPAELDPRELPSGIGLMAGLGGATVGFAGFVVGRSRLRARRTPIARLKRALRTGQISVHYQPLVRLDDGRLRGAEALARWRMPDGSFIPPDNFVPLAERSGLLPALTRSVVTLTLAELAPWLRGDGELYVSINIGVTDLMDDRLGELLIAECERHGIDRHRVALEITERVTDETARIASATQALRDRGFRIFLDDFGSGYSSLAYLATLPIDTIKLDKLFSRSVGTSFVAALVLEQICRMVETLDLTVVFEGVETQDQAEALQRLAPGAIGQGWLFGHPMPAAELLVLGSDSAPKAGG